MNRIIEQGFSRRSLLQSAAVAAGAVVFRGFAAQDALAAQLVQLGDGKLLPGPDFSQLRHSDPYVIGVRPHRKGGARLELEAAPLQTPSGKKYVIHNYGHGGAGITLSWGCASFATELVEKAIARARQAKQTPRVAVLGTGAIGLTAATEIRRKWPAMPITVYAKDLDVRATTSFVAGGQFEPSGIYREYQAAARKKVLASYLRRSRDRIVGLQRSSQGSLFGIDVRKDYTLDQSIPALDGFTPADVVPAFRRGKLPFEKLNVVGREYTTWLMNPHILLPKLVHDLKAASVQFVQRQFATKKDLAGIVENIIVNCTGLGAKKLFGDNNVIPERGHLVVLEKTAENQSYFFSGDCANRVISYVFCRQDDIVVGGTVLPGEDSLARTAKDTAVFQRILGNARNVFDGRPAACSR